MNSDKQLGLFEADPELYDLCQKERQRQIHCLNLVPSENFASRSVLEALSSSFHNKYTEGPVGARFYNCNEIVDQMETLCQKRALKTFRCNPEEWGVNVQPLSGSPANFAVYLALVGHLGKIMGLSVSDGGHMTHGYQSYDKRGSASSVFFESMTYKVDPQTGLIDYDQLERNAKLFKPKIIIAGTSSYSRLLDYSRFRKICDDVGAILMSDMAHLSGMVAADVIPSPFEYSDIVTSTTHKSFRGPRSGIIFYRKGLKEISLSGEKIFYDYESRICDAVFPGLQGGSHNNNIAAVATACHLAMKPEFKSYQLQVLANCKALCNALLEKGHKIVSGGSDTHLLLVDLKDHGINGVQLAHVLECVNIACNKNACPGDTDAMVPSGVRFGTPALTSRDMVEKDMKTVADFIDQAVKITMQANAAVKSGCLEIFKTYLNKNNETIEAIQGLRENVCDFMSTFPAPGMPNF